MVGVGKGGVATSAPVGALQMIPEFDFAGEPIEPGLSVIEASAGTGKTYAISHLVPRLLLDGSAVSLREILLVTFTNDAARELAARVRRVLEKLHAEPVPGEEKTDRGIHRLREKFSPEKIRAVTGKALLDLDLLGVSTIHSFCQKVLQSEGTLCGLPAVPELIPDSADICERVLRDLWETRIAGSPIAAAVASAMRWKVDEDLGFLKTAIPMENPEPVPAAGDFEDKMTGIAGLQKQMTTGVCAELGEIFEKVTKWTKNDPGQTVRSQRLQSLCGASTAACPGFLDAVREIAGAPGWINGSTNKELKNQAEESRAVQIARKIAEILEEARWDFRISCLDEIRASVSDALLAGRQITYDGLIEALREAMRGTQAGQLAARLRERYKVALIDESQDTDDRQFEIFRKIFVGMEGDQPLTSHRLVLIGDPKQAIYAFRGADVNTYLAAKDLAGDRVFSLTETFRSPEPLVRATNALFGREGSMLKAKLDFAQASSGLEGDRQLIIAGEEQASRVECWVVPDDQSADYANGAKRLSKIAGSVAGEIVRILSSESQIGEGSKGLRRVTPGDFAVLVSEGRQAEAMADALLSRGVPCVRAGSDDIMASEEAAEILTILRSMHEPRRSGLRLASLATRILGATADTIRSLGEGTSDDEWMEKFLLWQEVWLRRGIAAAMAAMDASEGITSRLASHARGERRVTNLRQIIDLLEAATHQIGRNLGYLVRWLSQEVAGAEGRSQVEERQLQLESDAEAVKLVTMHSAKGLQYPLVFCPFLWSSKTPKGVQKLAVAGDRPRLMDISRAPDDARAALVRANLEDRVRLAYVAITRAQVKVWIYAGAVCGSRIPASALDWILREETPENFDEWVAAESGRGARHQAGIEVIAKAFRAEDVIRWMAPPPAFEERWNPTVAATSGCLAALEPPPLPEPWGFTSFSSLTREKDSHADGAGMAQAAEPPDSTREDNIPDEIPNSFLAAPGGQLVGTAVHAWMERWDFCGPDRTALDQHFARFPISAKDPEFAGKIAGMLEELRGAILPGMECTVAAACPDPSASEWHFQLPIHDALGASGLAEVFAAHGQPSYAAQLAALPADRLKGYLHGFLDRIAFHDGAWGVIDWKTNNLGSSTKDYRLPSLQKVAEESHYLLQAHLYLVALRRFLGPDARISGAWLVFLRGVASGRSNGILPISPSTELMADLDLLFAHPSR